MGSAALPPVRGRLRRLSECEELRYGGGFFRTAREVFDTSAACRAKTVFLLGSDPLTVQSVLGSELLPQLFRPTRLDDFLDGRSVAPLPLRLRAGAAKDPEPRARPDLRAPLGRRHSDGSYRTIQPSLLRQKMTATARSVGAAHHGTVVCSLP